MAIEVNKLTIISGAATRFELDGINLGATIGDVVIRRESEQTDIVTDTGGTVDKYRSRDRMFIEVTLAESALRNLEIAWGSSVTEQVSESGDVTNRTMPLRRREQSEPTHELIIEGPTVEGRFQRYTFRRIISLSRSQQTMARGEVTGIPLEFEILPEPLRQIRVFGQLEDLRADDHDKGGDIPDDPVPEPVNNALPVPEQEPPLVPDLRPLEEYEPPLPPPQAPAVPGGPTIDPTKCAPPPDPTTPIDPTDPTRPYMPDDPVLSMIVIQSPGSGRRTETLPFIVQVLLGTDPVPDRTVDFEITSGDGNAVLTDAQDTTNADGQASTSITLGNNASGSYTITATSDTLSATGDATTVIISLHVITEPGTGQPGDTLSFEVEVREDGTAIAGEVVRFEIIDEDGGASLTRTLDISDADGRASTNIQLRNSATGTYTVRATSGIASVDGVATVGVPLPVRTMRIITAPGNGRPGDTLPFVVEVQEDGEVLEDAPVKFTIALGDGNATLSATEDTTDADGQAQTNITLESNATGSYNIRAQSGNANVQTVTTVEVVTIQIITPPGSGREGETLDFVVGVRVNGTLTEGETVMFRITDTGDGNLTLNNVSDNTDSNGSGYCTMTLGDSATGSYTVRATSGPASVSTVVTVDVLSMRLVTAPGSGRRGETLSFEVAVLENGSPVSGESVSFRVASGDGNATLNSASDTSDTDGQAQTTITLTSDSTGTYNLRAQTGDIFIDATATVEIVTLHIITEPGNGDPGDTLPFVVEVRVNGTATADEPVDFSIITGDDNATLSAMSRISDSDGRANTSIVYQNDASGYYIIEATAEDASVETTATVSTATPPRPVDPILIIIRRPGRGRPGSTLSFEVRLVRNNVAVPNQQVSFRIVGGDGNARLNASFDTTDASGEAQTTITLGSNASGSYGIRATHGSSSVQATASVDTLAMRVVTSPGTGSPGEHLPFAVEITLNNAPVSGESVSFSITSGDGNADLTNDSYTTDGSGRAYTTIRLGTDATDSYTIEATSGSLSASDVANVDVLEPYMPPDPLSLRVVTSPGSGRPGDSLTFAVEVLRGSMTVSGERVRFRITSGDGNASLSPSSDLSDTDGQAQTVIRLGSSASGSYTILASAGSASVSDSASVDSISLRIITSPGSGRQGDTLPFVVEVLKNGSPASGESVTFSIPTGTTAITLHNARDTSDSSGRAFTTMTLGSNASGSYTIRASSGGASVSATATVNLISLRIVTAPGNGIPGNRLSFVVEVRLGNSVISGESVTFSVDGHREDNTQISLSTENAVSDSNGRASTDVIVAAHQPGAHTYTIRATSGNAAVTTLVTITATPTIIVSMRVIHQPGRGAPGDRLTFGVQVLENNRPRSNRQVSFSIIGGDGNVSVGNAFATSDADGQAFTTVILGEGAVGPYRVRAASTPASVDATVDVIDIDVQTEPDRGCAGDTLTYQVKVVENGIAATDEPVTFSFTGPDKNITLMPIAVDTDENGLAQTAVMLETGVSGPYIITATSGPAEIDVTLDIVSITTVSEPGKTDPGGSLSFVVRVDLNDQAAGGETVTFTITHGNDNNASLSNDDDITGSDGRAFTIINHNINDPFNPYGSYTISAVIGTCYVAAIATFDTV